MKAQAFILIGHLQVLEVPLSSLYTNKHNDRYYMAVRVFEESDNEYILSEVLPKEVLDYMDGKIGLREIFTQNRTYSFTKKRADLSERGMKPIATNVADAMLREDGLEDLYDKRLSHNSWAIKSYLRKLVY